jgi:transcriptional regulator with PAS, ATPase and Fis domain
LKRPLLLDILSMIKKEIQSDSVKILVLNEKKEVIFREVLGISHHEDDDLVHAVIQKCIEEKQPVNIYGGRGPSVWGSSGNGSKNILCLPFFIEGRPAGVLYLDRNVNPGPFTLQDLELLIVLSKPIQWVLKNGQEFREAAAKKNGLAGSMLRGPSEALNRIITLIDRVKDYETPVFISGESGTGKELVARAIHQNGTRRNGKFVAVNCGALPEHLLESELFGYVRGAFTGALRNKPGLIEEANDGTFFLDEIGDLPLFLQAKLLRLLQEKEIRRIGANRVLTVNGRFISATNKNIEQEVDCGNFRKDLYYRLKIITIEIPPLRERKEDLLFLLDYFLERYCGKMKRERVYLSPMALELLMDYSWPGNVRELQNEIQRCLVMTGEDNLIKEEFLSPKINPGAVKSSKSNYDFYRARAEFEKRFLSQALARWNYNRAKTAEEVGLSRQGLFKLIKKYRIDVNKMRKPGYQKKI